MVAIDPRSVIGTRISQRDLRESAGWVSGMIFLQQHARAMRKTFSSWPLPMRMLSCEQVMLFCLGRRQERPTEAQKFQTSALLPRIHHINPFL